MAVALKSAISLGPIYVPVSLYKTTRDIGISFNQLCKDSHQRVRYKKHCPNCDKEITTDDIVKGYEFEKDRYVTITEDELEKIKTKSDKTLHVLHFAKIRDIDSIYFEKNYYVVPAPGAEKAFEVLRQAMFCQKEVAVAKTVMGTKEELLVLYPTKDNLIAKILFYQEEIQEVPKSNVTIKVEKSELALAKSLISSMTEKFEIAAYHDEYQMRLKDAIEKKIAGQEIASQDQNAQTNIIDIMEAMKKMVEMNNNGKNSGTA